MRSKTIAGVAAGLMLVASVAWTASQQPPTQPTPPLTRYAGQMTEAHVWIDNRGPEQAVPVDLRDVNLERPLPVRVVTDPQTRTVRQLWEYRTVTLAVNDDALTQLNILGSEGWEAAGVLPSAPRATILFKRPRLAQ